MEDSKGILTISILVIALGICWLLEAMKVLENVDWVLIGMLVVGGILTMTIGGVDKVTVVVGPFLILTGIFAFLRQREIFTLELMVPTLVISLGLLMLLSTLSPLGRPKWLEDEDAADDQAPGAG
ncbi:MAG: hypothetical protein OER86_10720 [Phycisphaerae bacterium]|nr:hypothetical protein [Phycisphaerae bacterium]